MGTGPNGIDRTRSRRTSTPVKPAEARACSVSRSQWHPWQNRFENGVATRCTARFSVRGGFLQVVDDRVRVVTEHVQGAPDEA